ncbi:intraflagellar transport protein 81 homolog [Watersipora subatra]|uniref:intraflagellar transport protein 81 homolog n=1 Tax=Watersipora subatra TaxID=2589382 RepID=UPI00355BF8CD
MSEQLKYIVQALNKPPFSKSYNLISFDGLDQIQLLQALNDVCAAIESKPSIDIREEAVEQTALRLFTFMRVLKFQPLNNDLGAFKQALVTGDKPHIYTAIEWLLQRKDDLKKRAYLARFLVKVEVPADILNDDAVNDLFNQYTACIEEFKEAHKQSEDARNSGFSTVEIKKDIASMEAEKEQIEKRIDKLKRKVDSNPNSAAMITVARNLRMEKDRESKISQQRMDLRNAIVQGEQRIHRLQEKLRDLRQASVGATPEGLFHKLEEEVKINTYMVNEKIPKELQSKKKYVQDLQKVVTEPAMGQTDLDELNGQVATLNSELNQLYEKRMKNGDPLDDKLTVFRQQAQIVSRKKEAAAEAVSEARNELVSLKLELEEKQTQLRDSEGQGMLKGDEFRAYVNRLRSKSTIYKKRRQVLQDLRAESGVVSRTMEILKSRDSHINQHLEALEAKKGVSGYRDTQEELEKVSTVKSELDEVKGKTLEDMSEMVQKFHKRIAEKKSDLAPIIKELRPLRQRHQEVSQLYDAAKSKYDAAAAGYENSRSKVENEVRSYREEIAAGESRLFYLNSMMKIIENQNQKIANEMKAYMSSDPQERKKSFRDLYNRKIQEQETLGKNLRERQKTVRDSHAPNMKQMKMWQDVLRLMETKSQMATSGEATSHTEMRGRVHEDEERLVL